MELAHETQTSSRTQSLTEVVEFYLAYERYAIESRYIKEVFALKDLTTLPCTPSFVLGIINVRGQIISVIDLKKFFELPEKGITNLNRVIIIKKAGLEFGILADSIVGVKIIDCDKLQLSLPTLNGVRADYLKGVTEDHLIVLDGEKILTDKRIIVHEEVE